MKKSVLLSSLLCVVVLCFVVGVMAMSVSAAEVASGTCGENVTWVLDDNGTLTISGAGSMADYAAASDAPWYTQRTSITKLVIEDAVTSVGDRAFYNCTTLTDISIGEGVLTIGTYAFRGCTDLESMTVSANVTELMDSAFRACTALTEVTFGGNAPTIGNYVFNDSATSLTVQYYEGSTGFDVEPWTTYTHETLHVGEWVIDIEATCATAGTRHVDCGYCGMIITENYHEPHSYVENICSVCKYVKGLLYSVSGGKVNISGYIGTVTNLSIPDTIEGKPVAGIGWNAFRNCNNLLSISIPDGVDRIGYGAFNYCSNLESITFPPSIRYIDVEVFYRCDKLKNIYITDLEAWLNVSVSSPCYLESREKNIYLNGELLTDVVIPEGVSSIGAYALSCSSITSILIPDSVTNIDDAAFKKCINLVRVTIPESITTICESTFSGCINLKEVTIPESVISIGASAFGDCSSLMKISIPEGTTDIGVYAFGNCSSLESIVVPRSITSIGEYAFYSCNNIKDVYYGGLPSEWEELGRNHPSTSFVHYSCNDPVGHWEMEIENPTCTQEGYIHETCTCNYVRTTTIHYLGGHKDVDPEDFKCDICDKDLPEPEPEPTESEATEPPKVEIADYVELAKKHSGRWYLKDYADIYLDIALQNGNNSMHIEATGISLCADVATSDSYVLYPVFIDGYDEWYHGNDIVLENLEETLAKKQISLNGTYITLGNRTFVRSPGTTDKYTGSFCKEALGKWYLHENSNVQIEIKIEGGNKDSGDYYGIYTKNLDLITLEHNKKDYCSVIAAKASDWENLGISVSDSILTISNSYETKVFYREPTYPTEPKPTDPAPTEPKPTEPKPTEPVPTEPEATEPEAPKVEGVTRLAGADRLVTSYLVADQLKAKMGVEKFENIIVASGGTFADALPGSYLSAVKNAPILLTLAKDKYVNQTADYIKANLANGGTVYILGGESAVPASMEAALAGIKVQRVAGADRFGTNLAILKEAGVKAGDEILVCTAKEFADSLSASATGKPILLVYKKTTDEQRAYLSTLSGCKFTVVGGTTAVPDSIAKEMETYGAVTRLAGKDRLETSTMVAEKYFADATTTVVAYGWNFPDGLCGGSLAYAMDATLILTHSKEKLAQFTADYTTKAGIKDGFVLGGDGLVDDAATRAIFGMGSEPITLIK